MGRLRLRLGLARKSLGGDQSVANDLRGGRHHLSGRHPPAGFPSTCPIPAALGVWPAFVLLLAFSWIELVYPNPAVPAFIACARDRLFRPDLAGMLLFGCERWLERGEVFALVFGTFARFAPIELRTGPARTLWLRPFGAGLLDTRRGLDLDDGVRSAPACERSVRRRAGHPGMGQARKRAGGCGCPACSDREHGGAKRRPGRVLARVLRRLCRGLRAS